MGTTNNREANRENSECKAKNKQKLQELGILADWLRLPRWKEWEIKLEICPMPTEMFLQKVFSKEIKIEPLLTSSPQVRNTHFFLCS